MTQILIYQDRFRDKTFWQMTTKWEFIAQQVPNYQHWQDQGIRFDLIDLSDDRHLRHIRIWAEGPEETLTTMVLKEFNK